MPVPFSTVTRGFHLTFRRHINMLDIIVLYKFFFSFHLSSKDFIATTKQRKEDEEEEEGGGKKKRKREMEIGDRAQAKIQKDSITICQLA